MIPLLLASAIVIRHDKPDATYLVARSKHPAVTRINGMAEGTLVGDRWVLTAAHVVTFFTPFTAVVEVGDQRYRVKNVLYHPLAKSPNFRKRIDLALLVLDKPVKGVAPIPLYAKQDEVGQIATLIGAGMTGTGFTGMKVYDRKTRLAQNKVDRANSQHLIMSFSHPSQGALPNEGTGGEGDSGSPAFLIQNGRWFLAGVTNKTEPAEGGPIAGYGSEGFYSRVSLQRQWILDTMNGKKARDWGWSAPVAKMPPSVKATCVAAYFQALKSEKAKKDFVVAWATPNQQTATWWKNTPLTPGHYTTGPNNRILVAAKSPQTKQVVLIDFYFTDSNPPKLLQVKVRG